MTYRYQHNRELTNYSRANRKYLTEAEKILWYRLRRKQLNGFKFRRQYPVSNFILDFYCAEKKLAKKLDGSQHVNRKFYDKRRSEYLKK